MSEVEAKVPEQSKLEALEKEIAELKKVNEELKTKELTTEEKIDALVARRIEEQKSKEDLRIQEARKTIAEAEENEKIEKELRENEKFLSKKQIRERLEEQLKMEFEKLQQMVQERKYFPDLFDSSYRSEKAKHIREFVFAHHTLGTEKFIENLKRNIMTTKTY